MDFLNWFDWVTPTSAAASIFFGLVFTLILGIMVWAETKERKTVIIIGAAGAVVTFLGVTVLQFAGFYG
ncbi:hypothetical protein [Halobacillus litoralis]|uniref:hypothetical protein n=1 Tax=Halobacillus litoralis TaxID=45668 RepID=UPI001CFDEDF5|nr:hypothetical protein [Halobacillus litoralis]